MFRWKRMTSQGESHLRSHMEETATWEGDYVEGPGRRGWLEHWAPKQGGALSKKSWNFVSIDREMPPWRAAVVFSKIVLKLIENCTWKREETNVLKVKSERKPAEKKLLKIAIAEQRRQKSSFWNIETSYCFYLATFSVPKWKRAKEPTKSFHGRRISWNRISGCLYAVILFGCMYVPPEIKSWGLTLSSIWLRALLSGSLEIIDVLDFSLAGSDFGSLSIQ